MFSVSRLPITRTHYINFPSRNSISSRRKYEKQREFHPLWHDCVCFPLPTSHPITSALHTPTFWSRSSYTISAFLYSSRFAVFLLLRLGIRVEVIARTKATVDRHPWTSMAVNGAASPQFCFPSSPFNRPPFLTSHRFRHASSRSDAFHIYLFQAFLNCAM